MEIKHNKTAMATEQQHTHTHTKRVAYDGSFNGYCLKVWRKNIMYLHIFNWKWIPKMDCGVSHFIWVKYTIFEFISMVLFNWNWFHSNECCLQVSFFLLLSTQVWFPSHHCSTILYIADESQVQWIDSVKWMPASMEFR